VRVYKCITRQGVSLMQLLGNKKGDIVPISKDLFSLANQLVDFEDYQSKEVTALADSANDIGESWSGSWFGYHSRVYYEGFQSPPPGAAFSQEWGFQDAFSMGTRGEWREYKFDDVVQLINDRAGNPDLTTIFTDGEKAIDVFEEVKSQVLSSVYSNFDTENDKFLKGLVEKIEKTKNYTESDFVSVHRPTGQMRSRDMIAIEKGLVTPPHIAVLAKAAAAKQPFQTCNELKKNILKLASYLENLEKRTVIEERIGTNIFIGHGRSPFWRELKDFISDRMELPWDEFNSVPVAGVTNITRLAQMLDQASIAFLIMTAEDEQADGNHHARMNVIHEVGLFQGRLGFERAIVLLEDGCEEFSNIQGLGQIRFPKGNISAIFEDVRQVLEREGIVE
ncbi:MAG: nucleotide-binding protein, partial [Cycloclasticus sp.]|nr:nucleotide-binding protein [Cycloclasticus sp.]